MAILQAVAYACFGWAARVQAHFFAQTQYPSVWVHGEHGSGLREQPRIRNKLVSHPTLSVIGAKFGL